jgi:hypothetical protein
MVEWKVGPEGLAVTIPQTFASLPCGRLGLEIERGRVE